MKLDISMKGSPGVKGIRSTPAPRPIELASTLIRWSEMQVISA